VIIRSAKPEDALAIATVHVEAWKTAYRGIVPDEFLDSLSIEQRSDGWRRILSAGSPEDVLVAQAADTIVGWISAAASRDPDAGPSTGEIWAVYVAPAHWRTGIGRLLCQRAERRLVEQGLNEVTLWVLKDNRPAQQFYSSTGFMADPPSEKTIVRAGKELQEIRMRKRLG
jgi:ribosomal protein S18 acetylase RimI-like enzyme